LYVVPSVDATSSRVNMVVPLSDREARRVLSTEDRG
jgi:hypothetical protein